MCCNFPHGLYMPLYMYQLTSVFSSPSPSPTMVHSVDFVVNLIIESMFNFQFISKSHQSLSLSLSLGQLHFFSLAQLQFLSDV